ncbi:MAG: superoxide dismutase [Dehalococcoidia bacterium]
MKRNPVDLTRREVLAVIAGATAAVAAHPTRGGTIIEERGDSPRAYLGGHEPRPLAFDPGKLRGLSEKLLRSHHENNYTGAVKRLNLIEQEIGQLPKDAPPYRMGALKREELIARGSMVLHELYFGNLGGDGKLNGTVSKLIAAAYGSVSRWEDDFRLTSLSLAGGSGWVVLAYDPHQQAVHNYWSWDHAHAAADATSLLVMDMYEHAYAIDYGANARGYIDAFFQNIQWDEVNRRVEAAQARRATT